MVEPQVSDFSFVFVSDVPRIDRSITFDDVEARGMHGRRRARALAICTMQPGFGVTTRSGVVIGDALRPCGVRAAAHSQVEPG